MHVSYLLACNCEKKVLFFGYGLRTLFQNILYTKHRFIINLMEMHILRTKKMKTVDNLIKGSCLQIINEKAKM